MSKSISEAIAVSKQNPININTIEEMQCLRRGIRYKAICPICKKEYIRSFKEHCYYLECTNCKKKQTAMLHYGVDNPAKSKEVMSKIQDTNLSRYGNICSVQGGQPKEKAKQTLIEKYGVEHPLCNKDIQQKCRETVSRRYGVDCAIKVNNGYERSKKTRLQKYGPSMGYQKQFKYDNILFDSAWELDYYIYMKDHNHCIQKEPIALDYYVDNKLHHYYPDFIVDGKLVEIKSNYWIQQQRLAEGGEEKFECIKRNNIKIISNKEIQPYIEYVKNTYGKDYENKFKI